jgi:purine-binding chemotaxis protein CheW
MEDQGSSSPTPSGSQRFVTFLLERRNYALPLDRIDSIQRMVAVSPIPGTPPWMPGVIDVHGTVLPVIDLRQFFNHPQRPWRLEDRLLIVFRKQRQVALVVDEVKEVLNLSPAELSASPDYLPGSVSAVVRRGKELLLILDLDMVLPDELPV